MVSRVGPLCLAVVLILTGCTGASPPAADTSGATETTVGQQTTPATATAEPTPTTTATATATTTTAHSVHTTLDVADLSESDRDLLRRAAENGSVQVRRVDLSGRLTPETDGWRVRYRGTRYELSWRRDGFYGEYQLENATAVNASTVDSDEGVVTYENLTADARRLFDAARSGNESEGYNQTAFPNQFQNHRYVKYDGDYYALEIEVGDYIVYRLTLTPVES